MSFAAITFCVASQQVFIVVSIIFDSVQKLLDTPLYIPKKCKCFGKKFYELCKMIGCTY
jgi:hypothetical protein